MAYVFEFSLSEGEFIEGLRNPPKRRVQFLWLLVSAITFWAVVALAFPAPRGTGDKLELLGILVVGLGAVPAIDWWNRRNFRKSRNLFQDLRWELDDAVVRFRGPLSKAEVQWSYFSSWRERPSVFVLVTRTLFYILPKRCLPEDQWGEFRSFLNARIRAD